MQKTLKELLKNYKCSKPSLNLNYMFIPVTALSANEDNAQLFNKILATIRETGEYKIINRTKSGGISLKFNLINWPAYDFRKNNAGAEITLIDIDGCYRIQFRAFAIKNKEDEKELYGRQAFSTFQNMLKNDGINLNDYAINNGEEIKKEIEKPIIKLEDSFYKDIILDNVHHIDFHNSYPAGLVNVYPEFRSTIEKCYKLRKTDSIYKSILNLSIGFMQSSCINYKYAHLAKAAIADNNKRIRAIADKLRESGRAIIAFNTDGIWYTGDIYHDENEGPDLGQWENDHVNCKFRAKSAGSYEFIEDDKYYPVVRGQTTLDKVKDRSTWQWGDIYKATILKYKITDKGVEINEEY